MHGPERITSPYAPDLGEVRAFLERMIRALRFVELVSAILAFVSRVAEVNGELSKKLADLRRRRPRSESLERRERQLVLPLGDLGVLPAARKDETASGDRARPGRKGRHPGRAALPGHLARVEVTNSVPPEQRLCPLCGTEMTTVGHSRCEILSVIPAKVFVEVRLDERVACPKDDTIVSASAPPAIVERGKLADALIVEATCDKYLEHTPVERQCSRFARLGVDVAPQTLGRSVAAHLDLLAPLARLLADKTRGPGLLGTDSTVIPVLDPDVIDGIRSGAMWCWTNARWVSFFYSPSADSDSVRRFLGEDLARTVRCDGTSTTSFLERAGGARTSATAARTVRVSSDTASCCGLTSRPCAAATKPTPAERRRRRLASRSSFDRPQRSSRCTITTSMTPRCAHSCKRSSPRLSLPRLDVLSSTSSTTRSPRAAPAARSPTRASPRIELDAGRRVWEAGGRRGAANGSLMRVAPIGVFFASDDARRRQAALADSALTHFDPRCQLACAAFTAAIAHEGQAAAAAAELSRASEDLVASFPDLEGLVRAARRDLDDDLRLAGEDDPQLGGLIHSAQGFVRVAFRAAFWELAHAPTFAAGLVDVVNRGGDADTNGAIAGALLGARHGAAAIPDAWRGKVMAALQDGPASALRDAYHPKVLLAMLEASR